MSSWTKFIAFVVVLGFFENTLSTPITERPFSQYMVSMETNENLDHANGNDSLTGKETRQLADFVTEISDKEHIQKRSLSNTIVEFTMNASANLGINWTLSKQEDVNKSYTSMNAFDNNFVCPSEVRQGINLKVYEKSLCPWYYKVKHDPTRYPASILEAIPICKECIGAPQYDCAPIHQTMKVLRQGGEADNGNIKYIESEISVTVGYTCSGKNTQSEHVS